MKFSSLTACLALSGLSSLGFGLSAPVQAQAVFVGEVGACMMETVNGEIVNIGTCKLMPVECTPTDCTKTFEWSEGFSTVISGGSATQVREGTAMNGQPAYAPAALVQSDPRDCIYNEVSDAVFCWVPGVDAMTAAINTQASREMLIELAAELGSAPVTGSGKKGGAVQTSAIHDAFQGKYRPVPSWDCGEVGRDGGAVAIEGNLLLGLESECELRDGQPVGAHGAVLFQAQCTGEGESWTDEYILRRDEWGALAVLSADSVNVWQSCE